MASLYKRERSPFWWVEYLDAAGSRRQISTKLRHDITIETRKARELERELTAKEGEQVETRELWNDWVLKFLKRRYSNSRWTLERYQNSWRNVIAFLDAHNIIVPRQLTRQQVIDFIDWRQERHSEHGVYEVCKNTALHEVKLLRIVMKEAVLLAYASANPCLELGIPRDKVIKKPRITEEEHKIILKALGLTNDYLPAAGGKYDWMQVSYSIAWEQGCRFSETCLSLDNVDLKRMVIGFITKGHKDENVAEFPLSSKLVPMFQKMKREKCRMTFEMPNMPGKKWWQFFNRVGLRFWTCPRHREIKSQRPGKCRICKEPLSQICFHSTRVTFITRCYEGGIHRDDVMQLAGHATYGAHAVYPRVCADHSSAQALRAML